MTAKQFAYMLTLILITLKLGQIGLVADLSWWWVVSPLWVPIVALWTVAGLIWAIVSFACWVGRR